MRCCACSGRTRSFGILAATRAAFSIVLICPQAAARGRSNVTSKAKSARVSPDFEPSWSLPCERNVERSPELAGAQTAPHGIRTACAIAAASLVWRNCPQSDHLQSALVVYEQFDPGPRRAGRSQDGHFAQVQ